MESVLMLGSNTIGRLYRIWDKTEIEWKIPNFSTLVQAGQANVCFSSPVFNVWDSLLRLKIYLEDGEDHFGLYLIKEEGPMERFWFGLKVIGEEKFLSNEGLFVNGYEAGGHFKLNCRVRQFNYHENLNEFDSLTVICKLRINNQLKILIEDSLFDTLLNMSHYLKGILIGGQRSDVVLRVGLREFKAHRVILEARSPVFAAMLRQNMAAGGTGLLEIEEDMTADVMEDILSYIYCSSVDNICDEKVYKLYEAAKKYELVELKAMCQSYFKDLNLSTDFIPAPLAFSYKYKDANSAIKEENQNMMVQENDHCIVGKLSQSDDFIKVEWLVNDFSTLSRDLDVCYCSPAFAFCGAFLNLKIYPNGESEHQSKGCIGLYVTRLCGPTIPMEVCLKIRSEDMFTKLKECEEFTKWGTHKFCNSTDEDIFFTRDVLETELLPLNILTIRCSLTCKQYKYELQPDLSTAISGPFCASSLIFKRLLNLSHCLKGILTRGQHSDIIFTVEGQEFKAHKMILEARSKVFTAMFNHDLIEKRTGIVQIEDIAAHVFYEILCYIYSGRVDNFIRKNVCDIYVAADKYDLEELKKLCQIYMEENMCEDLFFKALQIVPIYDSNYLKLLLTEYVVRDSTAIREREEWQRIDDNNYAISNQILAWAKEKEKIVEEIEESSIVKNCKTVQKANSLLKQRLRRITTI